MSNLSKDEARALFNAVRQGLGGGDDERYLCECCAHRACECADGHPLEPGDLIPDAEWEIFAVSAIDLETFNCMVLEGGDDSGCRGCGRGWFKDETPLGVAVRR